MTYISKTSPFNGWKWFSIALAIVAVFLLYKTCNHHPVPATPSVIPVSVQKQTVKVDSVASQKYKDSVIKIVKEKEKAADEWYNEWKASEMRYNDLEKGVAAEIDKPVPDTCKEIKDYYVKQINALSIAAKKGAIACEGTIKAKDAVITQKDALLSNAKEDYRKLKINFDTCISQQQKLTSTIKKVKSKNELYAGIMAMGAQIKPFEGAGVSLGLRTKKGRQFEVFALQFNSNIHYGVSYKIPFAKF